MAPARSYSRRGPWSEPAVRAVLPGCSQRLCAAKLSAALTVVRQYLGDDSPKGGGVIALDEMRELVNDDVVAELRRE